MDGINFRLAGMELTAILVCYIMLMVPTAMATDVNILYNGELKETTTISSENLVNRQISVVHLPSDITWTNVKVLLSVSSASMAKSISKILVFKCKNNNPIDCIKADPLEFESYVDTELSWNDISERTGAGMYPQTANLLMLVKLDGEGQSWVGFWDTVERTNYNVFSTKSSEIGTIDVEAKALELITPIKNFITKNQMLPMTWLNSISISASSLYGVGGNDKEMDSKELQGVRPPSTTITSVSKDYFFIFPQTASINHPLTVNRNPTYTCGNNMCESSLGETQTNCCYDCGCPEDDDYCNVRDNDQPSTGTCSKTGDIALEVLSVPPVQVADCTKQVTMEVSAKVLNAPYNLPETASGRVTLKDTTYTASCARYTVDSYKCPLTIPSPAGCGFGDSALGPNKLSLTITYKDGANQVSKSFERGFGTVTLNYDCGCPEGYYCDSSKLKCQPDATITLGVISVRSFIDDYNEAGDTINVKLKINNPPSDLDVTGVEYTLGYITFDGSNESGMTGSVTCTGGSDTQHVYDCSIPFSFTNYDHTKQYVIRANRISFDVAYSSAQETKTKELTVGFSDVTIPSYRCGDGTCHPEENSGNCCFDCGCSATGTFCDKERGCQPLANMQLIIDNVRPDQVDGCKAQHTVNITAHIDGVPSDARLDYVAHSISGAASGWPVSCSQPNTFTGIVECGLVVPPQDGDCQATVAPGQYVVGPNILNMKLSFSNGKSVTTKDLSAGFADIRITPKAVCGDGACETSLGESASNCCVDCPCEDPNYGLGSNDYYCDHDTADPSDPGTCRGKSSIRLVVDKTEVIHFDSCEKPNEVELNVQVANPPEQLQLAGWTVRVGKEDPASPGTIDENQSKSMGCTKVSDTEYDCKFTVEAVADCVSGVPYRYISNRIAVSAAYYNGPVREIVPLESGFGDIEIIQSTKTLFQIMDEHIATIGHEMNRIKRNIERLIDVMENCLTAMIYMAIFAMVIAIAGVVVGLFVAGGGKSSSNVKHGAAIAGAGKTISSTLLDSTKLICDMYKAIYETKISMSQAKIQVEQTYLCMDVYQHNLDTGFCKGNELSCMQSMISCFSGLQGQLNTNFNAVNSNLNNINQQANSVINGVSNSFTLLGQVFSSGTEGRLVAWINRQGGMQQVTADGTVCEHAGKSTEARCQDTSIRLEASCNQYPLIMTLTRPRQSPIIVTGQYWTIPDLTQGELSGLAAEKTTVEPYTFIAYCDKDGDKIPDPDEEMGGANSTSGRISLYVQKSYGIPSSIAGKAPCTCKDGIGGSSATLQQGTITLLDVTNLAQTGGPIRATNSVIIPFGGVNYLMVISGVDISSPFTVRFRLAWSGAPQGELSVPEGGFFTYDLNNDGNNDIKISFFDAVKGSTAAENTVNIKVEPIQPAPAAGGAPAPAAGGGAPSNPALGDISSAAKTSGPVRTGNIVTFSYGVRSYNFRINEINASPLRIDFKLTGPEEPVEFVMGEAGLKYDWNDDSIYDFAIVPLDLQSAADPLDNTVKIKVEPLQQGQGIGVLTLSPPSGTVSYDPSDNKAVLICVVPGEADGCGFFYQITPDSAAAWYENAGTGQIQLKVNSPNMGSFTYKIKAYKDTASGKLYSADVSLPMTVLSEPTWETPPKTYNALGDKLTIKWKGTIHTNDYNVVHTFAATGSSEKTVSGISTDYSALGLGTHTFKVAPMVGGTIRGPYNDPITVTCAESGGSKTCS